MRKLFLSVLVCCFFSIAGNVHASEIKVISPNGGEVFKPEQQITVTWSTLDIPSEQSIKIAVYNPETGDRYYLTGNPFNGGTVNDGTETFSLRGFSPRPFQDVVIPTGNNYQIFIYTDLNTSGPSIIDYSDSSFTINSSQAYPPPIQKDSTARIAYWYGKINQHIDGEGSWISDSDGMSGANIDKLKYCQKWYPSTTSIKDYKMETITTWRDAGIYGPYTSTVMTTQCVDGITTPSSIKVISPNGGENYRTGQLLTVKWISNAISRDALVSINISSDNPQDLRFLAPVGVRNNGEASFPLGYSFLSSSNYKVTVGIPVAGFTNPNLAISDESDARFTITNTTNVSSNPVPPSTVTQSSNPPAAVVQESESDTGCYSTTYSVTTGKFCKNTQQTKGKEPILTNPSINTKITITRILKIGSKGDDVRDLQKKLGIKADGVYGKDTASKVKAWQKSSGITADGIFSTISQNKINKSN